MADKSRISSKPETFNSFINNGDDYLQLGTPTNGTRLGLSGTEQSDWHDSRVEWQALYPKFTSDILRTPAVIEDVHNFIRDFKVFANPLLDIMAANPAATSNDEKTFNFIKRANRKKPERKTEAIKEQCFAIIKTLGGGEVQCGCRSDHDTKRPSLAEGADGVEVAYVLVDLKGNPGGTSGMGTNPIPGPNDKNMTHLSFSKAKFILECQPENSGKTLAIYYRWINSKYPKLAGPWGDIQVKLVL